MMQLFKSKGEEGYAQVLFRLAVYMDKRGAALLLDVRVNNRPDRYTMILSWDALFAANVRPPHSLHAHHRPALMRFHPSSCVLR